jgi:DNA-binding CsgD family transcriptional regulator
MVYQNAESEKPDKCRIYFVCENQEYYFTRREAECIVHLLDGKTVAETAGELELSRRTVEYYVNNMKLKLGCHSKQELLRKIGGANLGDLHMV